MSDLAKMATEILDEEPEVRVTVIGILAEFFQDQFREDPAGVSDWLVQGGTTVELFVEMVAALRHDHVNGGLR